MPPFGKVLDLLDERYLDDLQDVIGNVEPPPTLVPYENYRQNVLVYRIDTDLNIFMALLQDFTDRRAREMREELWTWCVQWEVDEPAANEPAVRAHSPKKPRLDSQQQQRQAPVIDIIERRVIDPELMLEEDMLRILIDIVQVDSSLVPNFIEFLYRWIDHYEGDGKALKAALRWEIPSLWDFEYHPLVLPGKPKTIEERAKNGWAGADHRVSAADDKATGDGKAEEPVQDSTSGKIREKPDLAALERQAEESERLQYREVKFGIQPPKLNEPVPPLINIPRDYHKRNKYYAACFRSRQRAYNLLLEAGITIQQINNYQKQQPAHPRDTPQNGNGNGLRHYQKDAQFAQTHYVEKEKQMVLRKKQMEIAISNKLALEAHIAAHSADYEAPDVPLIPPTPSERQPSSNAYADFIRRLLATAAKPYDGMNVVPKPLVGRMKSKFFEGAKEREAWLNLGRPYSDPPITSTGTGLDELDTDTEDGDDEDTGTDGDSEDGDSDDGMSPPFPSLPSPLPPPVRAQPSVESHVLTSNGQHMSAPAPPAASTATDTPDVAEYFRNLTTEQAQRVLPILNQHARQTVVSRLGGQTAGSGFQPQVPVTHSVNTTGLTTATAVPSSHPPMPNSVTGTAAIGANQPSRPALPFPPPPPRYPTITVSSPGLPRGQAALISPSSSMHLSGQASSHNGNGLPQPASVTSFMTATPRHQPNSDLPQLPLPVRPPPSFPTAPGLSAPAPPAFAQRLLDAQRLQDALARNQGLQSGRPANPQNPVSASSPANLPQHQQVGFGREQASAQGPASGTIMQDIPYRPFLPQPTSMQPPFPSASASPLLVPPRPGITRNAPSPLTLPPMPTPPLPSALSSLAPSLHATSPFQPNPAVLPTPIQIYFPKVLVPGNSLGPSGKPVGNDHARETDALLLGYSVPGSGKVSLHRAIFLPIGVWGNVLGKVQRGKWKVVETYLPSSSPVFVQLNRDKGAVDPHRHVYAKLAQAYGMMMLGRRREQELTKRWRVSKGPLTLLDRGAVWEGWGVVLDRAVEMSVAERKGAMVSVPLVGGEMDVDEDTRRWKADIEELLAEFENEDEDVDMDMGMEME